jgi:AcrR family transcriptional regulator
MPAGKYHHGDLKKALIEAGIEILSKEGAAGLSLRKVAQRAGVSHSAPYAHFPDKQALVAAISTEGFSQLYEQINSAVASYAGYPKRQLIEGTRSYAKFAMEHADIFKIMFSSILEKETDYPEFVEVSQKTFESVVGVVRACQAAGVLDEGSSEVMAVAVWGQVHGIVSLILEGQISHDILNNYTALDIASFAIEQITLS